jgi:hypothetical protein
MPCVVLVLLGMANTLLTWAHVEFVWGDVGRWLHEIDRYAQGEAPYRDFFWAFPPASIWLLGGIARLFGSQAPTIWAATSCIFLLLVVGYTRYVSTLLPRDLATLVGTAGLLLGMAYVHLQSATSLPMGSYAPGVPLGVLFLLLAVLCWFRLLQRGERRAAVLLGILCGACFLTKQDFWAPALYLAWIAGMGLAIPHGRAHNKTRVAVSLSFFGTLLVGLMAVGIQSGFSSISHLAGTKMMAASRGRGFPSGERITLELTSLALWLLAWFALARKFRFGGFTRRWLVASTLCLAVLVGDSLLFFYNMQDVPLRRALGSLREGTQLHLFPVLLPPALALAVWSGASQRRHTPETKRVLVLLGFCAALHFRRLFEFTDWFQPLLELPVYGAAVVAILPPQHHGKTLLRILCCGWILIGVVSYWHYGVGALTRAAPFMPVETARGVVYLASQHAQTYRTLSESLQAIDPNGHRPLFGFFHNGAFGYFLARRNPSPLTTGFYFSNFDAENVLQQLRALDPPVLVLDSNYLQNRRVESPEIRLFEWFTRWKVQTVAPRWVDFELDYMARLVAGCSRLRKLAAGGNHYFYLYDCKLLKE